MKNPRHLALQRELQDTLFPSLQSLPFPCFSSKTLLLRRCNQYYQYLPGLYRAAYQQMTQIAHMLQLPVKRNSRILKKFPRGLQNPTKITVNNLAFRRRHNIIKAPPLVHPQSQGTSFCLISKGKLHLISISRRNGTPLNPLEFIGVRIRHLV